MCVEVVIVYLKNSDVEFNVCRSLYWYANGMSHSDVETVVCTHADLPVCKIKQDVSCWFFHTKVHYQLLGMTTQI